MTVRMRVRMADGPSPQITGSALFSKGKSWCRNADLNRGPTDYESVALPLSYFGLCTGLKRAAPYAKQGARRKAGLPNVAGAGNKDRS